MAIVPSFFADLAQSQNIQALIDSSLDNLQTQSIWREDLDLGLPQASLTFESAIGRDRIEAAASIVDPDSPAPLRSRPSLELYTGKIPTMKEKFRMKQSDMRAIEVLMQSKAFSNDARKNALIKSLWDDVSRAATAGDKRVDILLMQAKSTLSVDVGLSMNPDGVNYGTVDLLAQPYQKQGVPVVWTDLANAKPIDDIERFVETIWKGLGRRFGMIEMSYSLWLTFKRTAQVQDMLKSFFNIGKANGTYAATLNNVNEMFDANGWPMIKLNNEIRSIEVDGKIVPFRPFNENNLCFRPAGKLGTLANAYPMELTHKIMKKSYANYGATLVSKWCDDDPLTEFTAMEMNAFPVLEALDGIFILQTNVVQANYVTQ